MFEQIFLRLLHYVLAIPTGRKYFYLFAYDLDFVAAGEWESTNSMSFCWDANIFPQESLNLPIVVFQPLSL